MATFFSQFPTVDIDPLGNGNVLSYTDLFRFVDVNDVALDNYTNYQWYEIEDGDRPDIVSTKLYNTPNFYWTFFIVNDRLKDGMREWPLSSYEFDEFIRRKYDGYGVAIIPPFTETTALDLNFVDLDSIDLNLPGASYDLQNVISNIFGFSTTVFSGENSIQGIDYKYEGLRVRREISTEPTKGARIAEFDSRKFQLWVYDIQDRFFFSSSTNKNLVFFLTGENPDADFNWLISVRDGWLRNLARNYNLYTSEYQAALQATTTQELQDAFMDKLLFTPSQFYDNAANAPRTFLDANGDPVCPLFCVLNNEGIPLTNREAEENQNFSRRLIRVIDPSLIRTFSRRYEQVLTSTGRLSA
jgi:hypothetical protein